MRGATRALIALSVAALVCMVTAAPGFAEPTRRALPGQILLGTTADPLGVVAAAESRTGVRSEVRQARDTGRLHIAKVHVPDGREDRVISALRSDPAVRFAQPNWEYRGALALHCTDSSPATCGIVDAGFPRQWHLNNDATTIQPSGTTGTADADIDAPEIWNDPANPLSPDRPRVCVVDSGIQSAHPDFVMSASTNVVALAKNFTGGTATSDFSAHGTHVAGIVSALKQEGHGTGYSGSVGVSGHHPAPLLNAKVFRWDKRVADDVGTSAQIASGIRWCADNAGRVINLSLALSGPDSAVQSAIEYAWGKGSLIVAAAGNNAREGAEYPAAYPNVIGVASLTNSDRRAATSNYGTNVDVAAPGDNIYSTVPTYANQTGRLEHAYMSGTSMAAPIVSGIAAMVWARVTDTNGDGRTNDELMRRLIATTDPVPGTGSAHGAINARWAVRGSRPAPTYAPAVLSTPGLVGYWRMDESVASSPLLDASGAGLHGGYKSGGQWWLTTPFGFGVEGAVRGDTSTAVRFNQNESGNAGGTASIPPYGSPGAPALELGSTATYEFWLAPSRVGEILWLQATSVEVSLNYQWQIEVRDSRVDNGTFLRSSRTMAPGAYHHVAIVMTPTDSRVYVDGVDTTAVSLAKALTPLAGFGRVQIAGSIWEWNQDGVTNYECTCRGFGTLDELAVYNRPLDPAEAMSHFQAAKPGGRL